MEDQSRIDMFEPIGRGVAQAGVRIANERAVLTLVATSPGLSNADLARRTGLGPQTTSRIVSDLEARSMIMRGEVLRGRRGQPATPLFINPRGAYCIGVEIGWRHREVLLYDLAGRTLATLRASYDYPDANTIFADVAADVQTLRSGMAPQDCGRLVGIGVAAPTFIHGSIARIGAPPDQVELWRHIDIAGRIAAATGLPAQWFNDGSAACWAEILAQPIPRPSIFAYLHVGTFVGAGIVVNGALWEDPSGNAADLGSIVVGGPDGVPTYVHMVASLNALDHRLRAAGMRRPLGFPQDWDWDALEPVASAWLDEAGRALATAVLSTRAMIDIERAVIDGVIPRAVLARLLERTTHHLAQFPTLVRPRPRVEPGLQASSAAATGAAQLLLFRRYFSRSWHLLVT